MFAVKSELRKGYSRKILEIDDSAYFNSLDVGQSRQRNWKGISQRTWEGRKVTSTTTMKACDNDDDDNNYDDDRTNFFINQNS